MNYEKALQEIALKDERYIVMTAENRAAIRNLPDVLGERFIDTGITEQAMIGAAAGMALRGRIPVVHALACFLTMRGFEFIRSDIGVGKLPVKLVGCIPGFLSDANGPTHQALEDIALMRLIPGMGIFCPADEAELVAGLPMVLADESPYYIRHISLPPVVQHHADFQPGKAECFSEGTDIAILTYGLLFRQAWAVKERLENEGLSVRLLNLRTLRPIDAAAILQAAQETRLTVILEDHFQIGGLVSIVSELLVKHCLTARVLPLALPNRWFKPALLDALLEYEGFTAPQLAIRILEVWNQNENSGRTVEKNGQ